MSKKLNILTTLLVLVSLVLVESAISIQVPRPRGVSISRASLYSSNSETFTCFDGLKTIKFEQINDDYCDCADASDEPGTSACTHGQFHCTNLGHRSMNLPSSRVNDGICDCCDGSDEYASAKECKNICLELGKEEQMRRKSQEELYKNGAGIRADMISKGKQLQLQRLARLEELQKRKAEQESIKAEKEELKKNAEAMEADALEVYKEQQREEEASRKADEESNSNWIEAQELFLKYDTNKDGFVDITELQVDMVFDKDRDGVVDVEEAKYFLDERDRMDLNSFVTISWSRIKPYFMLAEGIFKPPVTEGESDDAAEQHHENQQNVNEDIDNAEDHENNEEFENEDNYDEEEADVGEGSVVEDTIKPEYDPETQRLIELANEARNAFSEVEREIREIEHEIRDIEDQNAKDYGLNEEFAVMDGECYTYEDREYVYKLCPFDRASQQQRSGGSETTLGRWDQWSGDADNKYTQQKYSHGASCWNGPQRSAIVQLKCALEHQITSVTEPNRCEYFFVFETPAACGDSMHIEQPYDSMHDEL